MRDIGYGYNVIPQSSPTGELGTLALNSPAGGSNWADWAAPAAAGASGLFKGLAAMLMGGGKSKGYGGLSLPSKMSPWELAEWLAALSPDPGRMKF